MRLPREQQKLVADLIPSQITAGGVQRVLQSLLARAGLHPRPADDPGGRAGGVRRRGARHSDHCRACPRAAGAADQRQPYRARRLHAAGHAVGRVGDWSSPRRWPGRRRTASSRWRRASCRNSCSGCATRSMPPPRAGEAPVLLTPAGSAATFARSSSASARRPGAGAGRDPSARAHPHGGDDVKVRADAPEAVPRAPAWPRRWRSFAPNWARTR